MNEVFDKLVVRVAFAIIICLILLLYKYAHYVIYPAAKIQLKKRILPGQNPANTLHFFGRIIGIGILFSHLSVDLSLGPFYGILGLFLEAVLSFTLYLGAIYLMESITLYNFEYFDEIVKRKNICYSTISFAQAFCLAILMGTVMQVAQKNILMILFIWLFAMTILGIASKSFRLISQMPFQKLILHKNMAVAFSFSGYLLGVTHMISNSINDKIISLEHYCLYVVIKLILSMIIFPFIQLGLIMVFRLPGQKTLYQNVDKSPATLHPGHEKELALNFGHGIFEGALVFTSALMTTLITGQIQFGQYYPPLP